MQKTKQEIIDEVRTLFPEDPTDEQLAILEDLDDSISTETEDWKQKYEDNDKMWRKKYTDRFNGKTVEEDEPQVEEQPNKKYLYSDLFKEE